MSLSNLLASIPAAGHTAAPDSIVNDSVSAACPHAVQDTTTYLHHLTEVAKSKQFDADFLTVNYSEEWYHLFSNFGGWSLLACGIAIVLFLLWLCYRYNNPGSRFRSLKWWFVIAWVLGFIVYDIGTCTGEKFSLFTNAPMAILHSLGMFLLESDVSAIHEPYHNSWIYMGIFSFTHALAALVSTLFVMKHFGYHIVAGIKMFWESCKWTKKCTQKDKTFVFWGLNEHTFRLIENIKKSTKAGNSYRIIVVRSNKNGDDSAESKTGLFRRVFSFLALRNSELERLQDLRCLSTSTYADSMKINPGDMRKERIGFKKRISRFSHRIFSIITLRESPKHEVKYVKLVDIIGEGLDLRSVRKILANKTRSEIHMLFLSDSDRENLHDVALLLCDQTINDFVSQDTSRQVKFYCHARYNSVQRVIEDMNIKENISVNVADSSHLNVELLKSNELVLPVNFVDVQADATVSSAFNALVVGFSEVGLDSARFLYEFGAFVKTGSAAQKVERSDFHLDVVDNKMSVLAGTFVANAPAVKPTLTFIKGMENKDARITLHEMDCCGAEFYLKMEKWIKKLNYIVIATEDDELNISTAVRIFKMATRYRDSLKKLCILVRAHNDDDGHIHNIAMHYNRLWAAQNVAFKGTEFQNQFRREEEPGLPLYIFGLDKDVYTYDNIIGDSLEQEAMKYKKEYHDSTEPVKKDNEVTKEALWEKDYKKFMQLSVVEINKQMIDLRPFYPTYGGVMRLRRTQRQDFANSLHKKTKELLAQKALKGSRFEGFDWNRLIRESDSNTYNYKPDGEAGKPVEQEIVKILNTLAQTEHLRWNASHEILGYRHTATPYSECNTQREAPENDLCKVPEDDTCGQSKCCEQCRYNLGYKDEVMLLHNCLRDWQNLNTIKRSYDYNVVDITLGITIKKKDDEKAAQQPNPATGQQDDTTGQQSNPTEHLATSTATPQQ